MSPDAAAKIIKTGFKVKVEKGAGEDAKIPDSKFIEAGCEIVDTATVFQQDIILKVRAPQDHPTLGKHVLPCPLYLTLYLPAFTLVMSIS